MHLLLSFPEHLADETAFITSYVGTSDTGDEEGTSTATTTATDEEDDDDDGSTAGLIFNLAILLLLPLGMYFLLIRPRRRMMRAQQSLQKSIDVGDEVILTSGVYGFITGFEEGSDVVWVEVDDDVQLRVSRAAISGKVNVSSDAAQAAEASSTGDTEAPPTSSRPSLKGSSSRKATDETEGAEPVDE